MAKIVYLHIGLPKTGSTTIQRSLYVGQEALRELGVHYLQTGTRDFDDFGHHTLVMSALGERGGRINPNMEVSKIESALSTAAAEIAGCSEPNVFISSELFSLDLDNREAFDRLRAAFAGCEVKIVLVLRDVVDFLNSVYAQRVRDGFSGDMGSYVNDVWSSLNWSALVERWARFFGDKSIILMRFEEMTRVAFVDEFVRAVFGLSYDGLRFPVMEQNWSLPHTAVSFLRELNSSGIDDDALIDLRASLHQFFTRHQPDMKRADFLSPESKTMLRLHCKWPHIGD